MNDGARPEDCQTVVSALHLERVYGCTQARARMWAPHLDAACWHYGIVTPARVSAFLAQIGHESGRLRYTREIWGPTPAQRRYEGRVDLGNVEPGDGKRFMGRGLIQLTGRANYARMSEALGVDLIARPDLLETAQYASLSAGEFWRWIDGNALADGGLFDTITRRINGGQNGRADRVALHVRAIEIMEA